MLPVPGSLDCSWYSRSISSMPCFAPQISDQFSKCGLHLNFSVIKKILPVNDFQPKSLIPSYLKICFT